MILWVKNKGELEAEYDEAFSKTNEKLMLMKEINANLKEKTNVRFQHKLKKQEMIIVIGED